ncbi:hypothetical protein AVEN_227475-1 [Araneus ventricosus]|uniref:Uncharacterized protein n=1 Tax=Araneus ventricosus TaxID=182803 RepID=A0A4Y2C3B6_ARAVE|nr:hypothetical protein AVEN_227475-1 [Araneus ventricosus]
MLVNPFFAHTANVSFRSAGHAHLSPEKEKNCEMKPFTINYSFTSGAALHPLITHCAQMAEEPHLQPRNPCADLAVSVTSVQDKALDTALQAPLVGSRSRGDTSDSKVPPSGGVGPWPADGLLGLRPRYSSCCNCHCLSESQTLRQGGVIQFVLVITPLSPILENYVYVDEKPPDK